MSRPKRSKGKGIAPMKTSLVRPSIYSTAREGGDDGGLTVRESESGNYGATGTTAPKSSTLAHQPQLTELQILERKLASYVNTALTIRTGAGVEKALLHQLKTAERIAAIMIQEQEHDGRLTEKQRADQIAAYARTSLDETIRRRAELFVLPRNAKT